MPMIEKVMFDLGNVLLKFDFERAHAGWMAAGATEAALRGEAMTALKVAYERGELSDEAFVEQATALCDYAGSREDFIRHWQEIFEENAPMIARLRHLASSGLPCFLLSNSNGLHVRHIAERYDVLAPFAARIFSHEAGSMKPDDAIFEMAIERFELVPEKTLYVDDLEPNIAAGRRFGFQCLHYDHRDHAAAESFLESLELGGQR